MMRYYHVVYTDLDDLEHDVEILANAAAQAVGRALERHPCQRVTRCYRHGPLNVYTKTEGFIEYDLPKTCTPEALKAPGNALPQEGTQLDWFKQEGWQ